MNLYQDTDKYICHKYKNHEDWVAKRIKGIGGSDASTLIGMNKWKNNQTLWEEKMGLIEPVDISNNAKVKYGTEAEAPLRELFALDHPEFDVQYQDNVTLQSKKHSWQLYSPDGLIYHDSGLRGIYEGKTVTIESSMQSREWKNKVPDNYFIQILHGLLVTDFDFVYLKALLRYIKNDEAGNRIVETCTKEYTFFRSDYQDDLDYLLEQEIKQYQYYINKEQPPLLINL